jgi:hypothetical protein
MIASQPARTAWGAIVLTATLVMAGTFIWPSLAAEGQALCEGEYDSFTTACFIGTPDAHGVTITDALTYSGQVRAYKFRVGPQTSAAHIYLGDLWYDVDLALWRDPPNEVEMGRWNFVAESRTFQQRVAQFVRPEVVVQSLEPETYTLFIHPGDGRAFDPRRPFTLRVALGAPVCATQRDGNELYQLGLTYQPTQPTPFSLMSFNAFVSPPYSDLFDFEWSLDGQPMPGNLRETMQVAVPDLPVRSGGNHRVEVTARGVRQYPDPDPAFRHVPPTLSVACSFQAPQ